MAVNHIAYGQLGFQDHGWLKARHHFSFGGYYNPQRMGFGSLRVINDDWIAPQSGFPSHPHRNMEIITFIKSGAIAHGDNAGNRGKTWAHEVQVMSAGSGIFHSEYNEENTPTTLYQIWIEPNQFQVKPRWEQAKFNINAQDSLPILVSGRGHDNALMIYADSVIMGGVINPHTLITCPIRYQAYILCASGTINVKDGDNQWVLTAGDGAEITNSAHIMIQSGDDRSTVVVIDAP